MCLYESPAIRLVVSFKMIGYNARNEISGGDEIWAAILWALNLMAITIPVKQSMIMASTLGLLERLPRRMPHYAGYAEREGAITWAKSSACPALHRQKCMA